MGAGCCCCCAQQNRRDPNERPQKQKEQQPLIPEPQPQERAVDLLQTQKLEEENERKKREEAERLKQLELARLQKEAEAEEERKRKERKEREEQEEEERKRKQIQDEINKQLDLFKRQLASDKTRNLSLNQSNIEITNTEIISYEFDDKELLGPIFIKRTNNSDDSSDDLEEIKDKVEILQYLQPGNNETNSFIIKFKEKQYFMKTFYGLQKKSCEDITQSIKNFQRENKQKQLDVKAFLANYLKYLRYYKKEVDQHDQQHITLSLISTIEQYNLYTFAADESLTLEIRIYAAAEIIQAGRCLICNDTEVKLEFNQRFLKPSNILLSVDQKIVKVSFSDWYYKLKSFYEVINLEDSFDPRYSSNIGSQAEQSGQILSEMDSEQQASFKLLLVMIFFNLDLSSDNSIGVMYGYNDLTLNVQEIRDLTALFKSKQLKNYIKQTIAKKDQKDQKQYTEIWERLIEYGVESFHTYCRQYLDNISKQQETHRQ